MASIREHTSAKGVTTYQALYRRGQKQTSTTFPSRRGAEAFVSLLERVGVEQAERIKAAKEGAPQSELTTVSDALTRYIDGLSGVQSFTITTYRTIAKQIAAAPLGPIPLSIVTRDDVAEWIRTQEAAGVASKTIKNRQGLLSAALARAVEDDLATKNVAAKAKIARTERREMTFLTPDEFALLLSRATPHYRPLLMMMFGTGLRLGEVTALRISDIHLEQKPVTVTVSRAWKKAGEVGPPKTEAGRRTLSLPPQVVEAIRPLMTRAPDELLFVNMAGHRILQATLHDAWQSWIEDTRIDRATRKRAPRTPALGKRPRIHDLRHSHAAWMIGQGRSLYELQRRLGHESITTTADTYGHLQPEAQVQDERAAANAFPALPQIES